MPKSDGDAIRFGERLLALLEYGSFTATYKYAVLLALLDLCLEHAGRTGEPPSSLTTVQLAEKVVELYWPQTVPFAGADGVAPPKTVLRQNTTGQAEIVSLILRFRRDRAPDPYGPLHRAKLAAPTAYHRLIAQVEWKLVEMLLPRLQQLGRAHDPFIYQIGWNASVKAGQVRSSDFDNRILLFEGAGENLVRLAPLIRPLAHREWTAMVAKINRDVVHESHLEDFLFGTERGAVARLAPALRELQDDRCFYCASSLTGGGRSTTSCRGRGSPTTASRTSLRPTGPATTASATSWPPKSTLLRGFAGFGSAIHWVEDSPRSRSGRPGSAAPAARSAWRAPST
jgi:hypothetical protein